ncbi:hypothetical protein [Taklimakanibacter lacteus]|uniref:hypothetical protein n=1 Tax=Taklimakanibacter lacteus TaxID=2268456 RepID=UPI000E671627
MQKGRYVLGFFAALLLIDPASAASTAAIDRTPQIETSGSDVASEIRIELTRPGSEALSFNARLSENGGLINRPVSWRVKAYGGETLLTRDSDAAELPAEPGDYVVEASYGAVKVARKLTLLEGQRLGVTLVFNVGGLRILPKLKQIGLPDAHPFTSIYKASGLDGGELVAITEEPGEILRLGAGTYRIESRFRPGNASAVAEVMVKPGRMSAVELDMSAGIARLNMSNAEDHDVIWFITDARGNALPGIPGPAADVVLTPGQYTLRTQIDGVDQNSTFTITPGQISAILQAN